MAELPPRKNSTPTKLTKHHISPLQVLLQMGFSKQRAEKALAATGYKSVQLASDFLLAHVNDPTLDDSQPREYILYLCPTGALYNQLKEFWAKSSELCGRNGAHSSMPHITIIPFFKAPDCLIPDLVTLLQECVEKEQNSCPEQLKLEAYISPNFMGFFLNEDCESIFKSFAVQFVKGLQDMNVMVEAPSQALHLTLAYHFPSSQFANLESLVESINPNVQGDWEFRLFSRDVRLADKEVYRVVYPHVPRETDELELLLGDFVYVHPDEWKNSMDGWVEGISWLTGCSGFIPKNYIDKAEESDAWTLHRTIKLNPANRLLVDDLERSSSTSGSNRLLTSGRSLSDQLSIKSDASLSESNHVDDRSRVLPAADDPVHTLRPTRIESPLVVKPGPRSLFIVRHGERVDFTFGTWIPYCFDESGNYMRKDLNMPLSVPKRKGSPDSFFKDCPLTCIGEIQARLLGEAMRSANVPVHHAFCSPSLRSLQTCRNILRGLNVEDKIPIALEPGLFEWLAWYQDSLPQFLSPEELKEAGFNLRENHRPFIAFSELEDRREGSEQYYMRSYYVTQCVLRSTAHIGGNILLVGHAPTLDACSRQLVGGTPRTAQELSRIVHRIPYCSMAVVQESSAAEESQSFEVDANGLETHPSWNQGHWKLIEPPVPPMTYSGNMRFDWQTLLM